jgi:spermidine synthase
MDKTLGPEWFSEVNEMWPGQAFSLRVKEVVHREKSKFQDIMVLER